MITVRRAVPADIGAMSDVLVASITALCVPDHGNRPDAVAQWLSNKTPEGVGKWFANPETSLFVADVEEVVAAVGAVSNRREILLNYVSPDHRFAGVSKALLAAMEAALGAGEARLTSTTTAHRFYQRTGWTDDGPAERYAGMTAYPMRKLL